LIIEKGETNTTYNIGNGKRIFFKDIIGYAKDVLMPISSADTKRMSVRQVSIGTKHRRFSS
jgi:hypothetical protein